jgi:DNA-binding GntR family transcriptional regulator
MPTGTRNGIASASIAGSLRDAILRGEIEPGARIRQQEIAADQGASRVPVREALATLESEGLVTLVANTGAWVAQLSLAECEELYQIRERIEPLLLTYSIPNLDAATVTKLDALAVEMESTRDVTRFLQLDREFHLTSYSGATTLLLGDTVNRLWNMTQHYRRAYSLRLDGDSNRIVHDEHHMLMRAIELGDADDAGRVLLGHIRRTRLELARHPEIFELRH